MCLNGQWYHLHLVIEPELVHHLQKLGVHGCPYRLHSPLVVVRLGWTSAGSKCIAYSHETRKYIRYWFHGEETADHSRKTPTTFVITGLRTGSWFQQPSVVPQTESVKLGSCGRCGRSPFIIFTIVAGTVRPLNGSFPVKAFGIQDQVVVYLSDINARRGEAQGRTSITTIAKEKMSASRVFLLPPPKASGAAHLTVYPCKFVT